MTTAPAPAPALAAPAAPATAPEPPKALLKALMEVFKDVEYVRPTVEGRDQDELYRVLRWSMQHRGVLFAPSAVGTVVDPTTGLASVQCRLSFVHVKTGQTLSYDWPGGSANSAEAGQITRALTGAVISFLKTMFLLRQGEGEAADPPVEVLQLRRGGRGAGDGCASPAQRAAIRKKQVDRGMSDLSLLWILSEAEGTQAPADNTPLELAVREVETRLNLLKASDVDAVFRKLNAIRPPRRRTS